MSDMKPGWKCVRVEKTFCVVVAQEIGVPVECPDADAPRWATAEFRFLTDTQGYEIVDSHGIGPWSVRSTE